MINAAACFDSVEVDGDPRWALDVRVRRKAAGACPLPQSVAFNRLIRAPALPAFEPAPEQWPQGPQRRQAGLPPSSTGRCVRPCW